MTFYTIIEFVILTILSAKVTTLAFKALGISVGNSASKRMNKMLEEWSGFFILLIVAGIVFPIFEELTCRGLPMQFSKNWVMMLLSTLVFALLHGLETEDGELMLPVPQFVLGLIFWNVALHYGLGFAILIHQLHNIVCVVISFISKQLRYA